MPNRRQFLTGGLVTAGGLVLPAGATTNVLAEAQTNLTNMVVKTYQRTVSYLDVGNAQIALTNVIAHFDAINYWSPFKTATHKILPTNAVFHEHYIAMNCWQHTQHIMPLATFEEVNHTFMQLPKINPSLPYDTLIANNKGILADLENTGLRPVLVNMHSMLTEFGNVISRGPTIYNLTNPGDPRLCFIAKETLLLLSFAAGVVSFICFATVILEVLCTGWAIVGLILLALRLVISVLCGI